MKLYIDGVDNEGNIICVMETMVTCEDCRFFRRGLLGPDWCMNESGMKRPGPDAWCACGKEKCHE